ncbi:MAG: alpha/beta hydrolase [Eubacterium sp.]|nr:alpha/beta hydrolase [Eubacterium sp.]
MPNFEIKTVKTSDAELAYMTFGQGKKAFVIIPGLSLKSVLLSSGAVADAYSMFAEDYTVYLFDRRKDMKKGVTIADFAADTAEAMKQLGIKGADILGTSQGGMIAMLLAAEHPELVSHLVVASSSARLSGERLSISSWRSLAKEGKALELCNDFISNIYSDAFVERYGSMLAHFMSDCTEDDLERFITSIDACDRLDITDKIKDITCPVLVIGAENDTVLTGEASRLIAEIIGCEIYMYGDPYRHAVYDEAPDYKERLLTFFSKQ